MTSNPPDRAEWTVRADRLIDDTPHLRIEQADIELPDGTQFTQYVFRMRRCSMIAILNETLTSILMLRRHRFITGQWVWEIPGGYADDAESGAEAAAREALEETGWTPRNVRYLLTYQPMIGNADAPQDLYIATGADLAGEPAADETESVRWIPIDEATGMIANGQIAGAATIIAIQHALLQRAAPEPPPH